MDDFATQESEEFLQDSPAVAVMKSSLHKLGKDPHGGKFTFTQKDLLHFTELVLRSSNLVTKMVLSVGTLFLLGILTAIGVVSFSVTFVLNALGIGITVWQLLASFAIAGILALFLRRYFR